MAVMLPVDTVTDSAMYMMSAYIKKHNDFGIALIYSVNYWRHLVTFNIKDKYIIASSFVNSVKILTA
jgi:hypothetical protein